MKNVDRDGPEVAVAGLSREIAQLLEHGELHLPAIAGPSQLRREYSRQFGVPLLRDLSNLRQMTVGESD